MSLTPVTHDGIKYLVINIEDDPREPIERCFEHCFDFIDGAVSAGGRVFVHCMAGVSRSATVVLAHLIARRNMLLDDAVAHVKSRRKCIMPNPGFRRVLVNLHQAVHGADKPHTCYQYFHKEPADSPNAQVERIYRDYLFDTIGIEGTVLAHDINQFLKRFATQPSDLIMRDIMGTAILRYPVTDDLMITTGNLVAELLASHVLPDEAFDSDFTQRFSKEWYDDISSVYPGTYEGLLISFLKPILGRGVLPAGSRQFITKNAHMNNIQKALAL
jgi:hypothetical protein